MPKYTNDVIAGYILYFTSKCVVEAMHVHASDKNMVSENSAKLYVYENGDSKVEKWGPVSETDMNIIQQYIKNNYINMYKRWSTYSDEGFYKKR